MLCCFGFDNSQQEALELAVRKLREENVTLMSDNRRKTEKLEYAQRENARLEKKVSYLEKESQVTEKSYKAQIGLNEDFKKRLLSCDEQLEEFKRHKNISEVEIQYLRQQLKRNEEEKCKLQDQILKLVAAEENSKNEYEKAISKLEQDLYYFVKQNEIRSEENLTLTRKCKELETVNALEKQKNIKTHSQQDFSKMNSNSLEYLKSKSCSDLEIVQETNNPYIDNKEESSSHGSVVHENFKGQIQILTQQLLELEEQNETLSLEKTNCEEQIIILQNELAGYKQKVAILMEQIDNLNKISSIMHPQIEINRTVPGTPFQSSIDTDIQPKEGMLRNHRQLDLDLRESLNMIDEIYQDTIKLEREIEGFSGTKEDKDFLHLNELLVRNVVKLDNVESGGQLTVREKRKEAIEYVQKLHSVLNHKVK